MLRKEFLTNPSYPSYFIYGGLFLVFLRNPLAAANVAGGTSFLSGLLIGLAALFIVAGFCMRIYQAKQNGTLKNVFITLGVGLALVGILMATGVIHTPAFLQTLF